MFLHNCDMTYSRKLATDFWYEFDNFFLWQVQQDVLNAIGEVGNLDTLYIQHRKNNTYPNGFIREVKQSNLLIKSISFLAQKQLDIINKNFGGDVESQQRAFEDFGQGVLFDDRPPRSLERRIHMMDEGPIGYRRWHAFIRTAVLINTELDMLHDRWLQIDRDVGLAYAIDSKQHPKQSDRTGNNPNNPEIDPNRLDELRTFWLPKSFQELDNAFDNDLS